MTLRVDPEALRAYADQLREAQQVADVAKRYINRHGDFDLHANGLMGWVFPGHRHLLASLNELLTHLGALTDSCGAAIRHAADEYAQTDLRAASAADVAYPAVPRAPLSRD